MNSLQHFALSLLSGFILSTTASAAGTTQGISSPDSHLQVTVQFNQGLTYSIQRDGAPLITPSRLGLEFLDALNLGTNVQLLKSETRTNETQWRDDFGKFSQVKDHYRELRLCFREQRTAPATPVDFEVLVRAYDDGVAWRYVLPKQQTLDKFQLTGDTTEFHFPGDYRAWVGQNTSYENLFPEIRLSQLNGEKKSLPLVVETPQAFVSVAEADVRDWAGCSLMATSTPNTFGARAALISPVTSQTPRTSPWHALVIGKTAGELTVSTLLKNLATPSLLADTSWIQPGITAWDAWWTGVNPYWDKYKGLNARGNTQSHKDYIDLAAKMGWRYMLVDWYWYDQGSKNAETAIQPQSHIDMPELMAYSKRKNVKLLLWVNSKNIPSIGAEKLFSTYKSWGAAGVKIDFFKNNGSQATQHWLEELLETAAKHQLVVDFHGIYTPTGLSRTWPNLLTQEGVLGVEYAKLGKTFSPRHMMTLPFTRGLLGPADVTPGAFLNVREEDFNNKSVPATVTGTRARQLALSVLMDSPLLCLCDSPTNYLGQPGLEFYRDLPTTWDETRALSSKAMEHLIQARRKGNRWYLVAMNAEEPLTLTVKLDFLGQGTHTLRRFADTPESTNRPTAIQEISQTVTSGDTLEIRMERAGGFAAVIETPKNP